MEAGGPVGASGTVGSVRGIAALRWLRRRRVRERARTPGAAVDALAEPGGGLIRFERSSLRVRVAVGGAVFCGWDGAGPEPSFAVDGRCPAADGRAVLEPDKDGGWRVVSERLRVTVARDGRVVIGTPGGVVLRRDTVPRWWEDEGGGVRWLLRSRVGPDAALFGLGGRPEGPRLPDGVHRLWNAAPADPGREAGTHLTMPVQWVVADAGCHLVFHDATWDGSVTWREGGEGAGSEHDREGRIEVRMAGGPLRYWVVTGTPSRILYGWTSLTGAPARPPTWALGHQCALRDVADSVAVRRAVAAQRRYGPAVRAVHLGDGRPGGLLRGEGDGWADLVRALAGEGVRTVPVIGSGVPSGPGSVLYREGAALGAFVQDAQGREVREGPGRSAAVFPDFTDPRVRKWWAGRCGDLGESGADGVCHEGDAPVSPAAGGGAVPLPPDARHALEGRGGDHREARNVYALGMAEAGYLGMLERHPGRRPCLLSRSGWAGSQRYGGVVSGEGTPGWAGLRASLARVLGLGLCGQPFSGPDLPRMAECPPELYLRWFQLAAFLPLFRGHGPSSEREPEAYGREVLGGLREALEERERLLPYFVTLARLAQRTGAPYVRPLWWHRFRDRELRGCDDAFLLGDSLLVAPVLEPGVTQRRVRLPRGDWYDTATGERSGGDRAVTVDAPLHRIPVLARAGSAIPATGGSDGLVLDVWPPAPGRAGSGLLVRDTGDGWAPAPVERLGVRWREGAVEVVSADGHEVDLPLRIRG
ncbi:glycoside hydrolase family 31 protein [Streptomyces sp. TR02-1]|uniref:glycoside hydrolase family 31 protein n=1 Tax=Streptomyces sp. TR02-1 TaxID=3385977 RepID=UPI0039A16C21